MVDCLSSSTFQVLKPSLYIFHTLLDSGCYSGSMAISSQKHPPRPLMLIPVSQQMRMEPPKLQMLLYITSLLELYLYPPCVIMVSRHLSIYIAAL